MTPWLRRGDFGVCGGPSDGLREPDFRVDPLGGTSLEKPRVHRARWAPTSGMPAVRTNAAIADSCPSYSDDPIVMLLNSCPESRASPQIRPKLADLGQVWAAACQLWPTSFKRRPTFPDLGEMLNDAGQIRPIFDRLRPVGSNFHQIWPMSTKIWQQHEEICHMWSSVGGNLATFGQG